MEIGTRMKKLFYIIMLMTVTPAVATETPAPVSQPTHEELENKLKESQAALDAARDAETSLANRLLTTASTAATGAGAMMAASALAEQNADADAERDMRAYIETMKCEYGGGQIVTMGNEDVTLSGGNELLGYYNEYREIAERLKQTKGALGLRSGIEAEILYDRAQSGLYQYASVGKTGGGETSVYRALTDTDSADALAWVEQKESTANQLKTGAIVAGAGVATGVIGNYLVNEIDVLDDEPGDEKLSLGQRSQKRTCRNSGGTWDTVNGCQCSASAGLELNSDKTKCQCVNDGEKYNKQTKKCYVPAAPSFKDIDITKNGIDWAGFNQDNNCMQKNKESIQITDTKACAKILSTPGTWWTQFSYSWFNKPVFYGESKCNKIADDKFECFCKPTRIVADPIVTIDGAVEVQARDYSTNDSCNAGCAYECASSFATSKELREQTLAPVLK